MAFRRTKSQAGFKLRDVEEFGKALNGQSKRWGDLGSYFGSAAPVTVVRAPARLDVMGGIADYSGSLVCEGTLAAAAVLGIQARGDGEVRVHSANAEAEGAKPNFAMHLSDLLDKGKPLSYDKARKLFRADKRTSWAAYIAGAFSVLLREGVAKSFPSGVNIVIASDIPWGAGISSSAAIEVAAMHALGLLFELRLTPIQIAALSQKVENYVVGAPCGIMDQIISAMGEKGYFLAIRCQPDCVEGPVKMPKSWDVVGINSNVKHSVGGSAYTDVRVSSFMGHRIILELMEQDHAPREQREAVEAYLCNLTPKEFKAKYDARLPTQMRGKTFLQNYGDTFDPVTKVLQKRSYRVRSRTGHPIYENDRVHKFIQCMEAEHEAPDDKHIIEAGRLMYNSHWSYRTRCGLDCIETNFIVRMARTIGIAGGIYGAKITGGGSGGTVAILGKRRQMDQGIDKIVDLYRKRMDIEPDVFAGSSPGALDFGCEQYSPTAAKKPKK